LKSWKRAERRIAKLDGTNARQRADRQAVQELWEKEAYWRNAYERGEPIPREFDDAPWARQAPGI
jgi:hypothetical protein